MHHKQLLVFKWTGWMENNWVTGMAFPWPWGQHFLSCGSATLLVNFRGWYYLSSPWPKWVLDSETDFVRFCPNSRMCPHPWSMEPVACNHLLWPGPYQAPGCAKGKKSQCIWDMPLCTLTASLWDMYSLSFKAQRDNASLTRGDWSISQTQASEVHPLAWRESGL